MNEWKSEGEFAVAWGQTADGNDRSKIGGFGRCKIGRGRDVEGRKAISNKPGGEAANLFLIDQTQESVGKGQHLSNSGIVRSFSKKE